MDYNDLDDPEVIEAIRRDPNSADSRLEMVEVVARVARRLAHAVDPTFSKEPLEPFDLEAEVSVIRAVALTITPGLADPNSLFMLQHREPDGGGPFDREIWLETMALARAEPPATRSPAALAYAFGPVFQYGMSKNELISATCQSQDDWAALAVPADSLDLNLPTPEDRRRWAIRNSGQGFILYEYYGWPNYDEA